jgi:alpha/beta superfamily hydrolase
MRSMSSWNNAVMIRVALLAGLLAVAACAPATATPDYAREARWAQEIVPQLVAGDPIWLTLPARPRVLAIFTEPQVAAKGGVVVVHGLGVHPDWALIGDLRSKLADRGYATLAVQMPVLAAGAPRDGYPGLFADAADRLAAAIAWMRAKGFATVAIVSHSMGASMADAYLARDGSAAISAWIPIGMLVDFTLLPRTPVLDVVAERDFPETLASAKRRAARLPRDGCSGEIVISATDHYMNGATTRLSDTIAAFLDRVYAGGCSRR